MCQQGGPDVETKLMCKHFALVKRGMDGKWRDSERDILRDKGGERERRQRARERKQGSWRRERDKEREIEMEKEREKRDIER